MSQRTSPLLIATVLVSAATVAALGQATPQTPARQVRTSAAPPVTPEARWNRAVDAWEAGKYPAALQDLQALMSSPASAEYFDRVALLTGELYVSTVLTADGRNPRISANGAFASFETGAGTAAVTRIVRVGAPPTTVAEFPVAPVAFDRAGTRVAWIKVVGGDATATEIVVRDLNTGTEKSILGPGLSKSQLVWAGDDQSVLFVGAQGAEATRSDIYSVREGAAPVVLTDQAGFKSNPLVDARGATLVYTVAPQSPFALRGAGPGRAGGGGGGAAGGGRAAGGGGAAPATPQFGVVSLANKSTRIVSGVSLTLSADGSTIAWLVRTPEATTLNVAPAATAQPTVVRTSTPTQRIDTPALSPDGKLVAYQFMTHTDWEIYVSDTAGVHRRLTRDIQHDLLPRFLSNTTLIGLQGEGRHRRSQLYDLTTGSRTRLFSNNTIRTVSPEYIWTPSADGVHLILQADRDGDTISPERSVTVLNLSRKISAADLQARLDRQSAVENDLRQRMTSAFKPVEGLVRQVLAKGAVNHVYAYEKSLFDFDSKHITQPGNLKAIDYIEKTYRSFGYSPEIQWFTPNQLQASGGKTGNIVATLKGTVNPELIYVVSSHFDSVAGGPGADDDTSGTAALLETARMLAETPLPATVVFASFTGEEAGLLGSTEFVRLATDNKLKIAGALNNDMIGWAADSSQINNTIRYSNGGIRDIQHGAAFLFTDIVLFDAKYYQGTDAAAFFRGWGDIVGGIGSYPILANPNYHQPTDFIETMNFKQILETAKVTAATLIYLASSPSRLRDVKATRTGAGLEVTWTPSPETGITKYVVAYGPEDNPMKTTVTLTTPRAVLPAAPVGTRIAVRAVNAKGLEGWDWARIVVQ